MGLKQVDRLSLWPQGTLYKSLIEKTFSLSCLSNILYKIVVCVLCYSLIMQFHCKALQCYFAIIKMPTIIIIVLVVVFLFLLLSIIKLLFVNKKSVMRHTLVKKHYQFVFAVHNVEHQFYNNLQICHLSLTLSRQQATYAAFQTAGRVRGRSESESRISIICSHKCW